MFGKNTVTNLILAVVCLFHPSFLLASGEVTPVLPANESILRKLKDLKPNHGVSLGKAVVHGDFNETAREFNLHKSGPMGRDFSIKMVWAPDRGRALYCGANHGVPHRLNDVWEFDLNSFSWILLYAPDKNRDYIGLGKDFSDVRFENGVLLTKRGGPAVIGHTWWGLSYDTKQKCMLFMNTWVTNLKKSVELLGKDPSELYLGPPLWSFDPEKKKWKMHALQKPFPVSPFGGLLEYIPELNGTIWHTNNWQMQATWLLENDLKKWRNLNANKGGDFAKNAAEPEQVGYYDPKRKIIIAHRHKATSHYDPIENAWKKFVDAEKDSLDVPFGHDAYAPMVYDSQNGTGLLMELRTRVLWSYDPDSRKWARLEPKGDPVPEGIKPLIYFDPIQNVLVYIQGTNVWAYRPKN